MGQVIPRVTVMRLKEMVATGELKQNFQQLWLEAMDAGNSTSVTDRIDRRWREYQEIPAPDELARIIDGIIRQPVKLGSEGKENSIGISSARIAIT